MLDTLSSQYNSFLFWRQPIPELDLAELEGLGLTDALMHNPKSAGRKKSDLRENSKEEEEYLSLYSTFNFWRAPIANIDTLDFDFI
ncbi:protein AF1q [Latimeria chalumnae]|uniref:Protein AF1q n=1 Tax=Latimeria chalumnae TaxID=7897 RepID=H3A2B1_LATCH|nr:PREDICTED: protein AF1q [Latimeria chalumnae]|eukprot:XP_006005166.1 PREDICTED: protein AF1q [Latimeria chalumnae]